MISLTQTQNRALAIGLLLVVLAVCYLVLVRPPIAAYRDGQQEIETLKERLLRYREIARQRSAHEKELEELKTRQPLQEYFLESGSDALAAAEMQDRVKSIIGESGGELASVRVLPVVRSGRFSSVSIQIQMTGTIPSVLLTFYALESAQPLLLVDEVYLQPKRLLRRRGALSEEQLDVRFTLTGLEQTAP